MVITSPDPKCPSYHETTAHIRRVQALLAQVITDLETRQNQHDASKLISPEVEYFDKYTPILSSLEYNSPDYKRCLSEMKPGLDHHYQNNDHHPEFFGAVGVHGMGLVQLLEMIVDWKAAGERHGGCIFRSIELNSKRFAYSTELKTIFLNTARYLGFRPEPTTPDAVHVNDELVSDDLYYIINNKLQFSGPTPVGTIIRVVFRCFQLDWASAPISDNFTHLDYNQILPAAVQLASSQ